MKTFYSLDDIENMAAQGVRELVIDDNAVLTDLARDAAVRLGLKLVPGARAGSNPVASRPTPTSAKPRGCQHGPLAGASGPKATAGQVGGALVDELVGAVKQLAGKGSAA